MQPLGRPRRTSPSWRLMDSIRQSLQDFKQPERTTRCFICLLPERQAIDEAYMAGTEPLQIMRWLQAPGKSGGRGYGEEATESKLKHHIRKHSFLHGKDG